MLASTDKLSKRERFVATLDELPWGALYRIVLGFVVPLLYYRVFSKHHPGGFLALWCLVLISLRVFPAIFRRLLPFSEELIKIWAQRRKAAKLYDSYQWGKVFWFGIGMACYMAVSGNSDSIVGALAVFFIISGALGLSTFARRAKLLLLFSEIQL